LGHPASPELLLTEQQANRPTHLIHDLDTKFPAQLDAILASEQIDVVKVGPAAPT
jgi:hypothetical protein